MTVGLVEGEALRHSYNLAREVQSALLPGSPPVIEGLDLAARNVYREETGGDYYDFLQTPKTDGNQLNVIMGDACGLGISSALVSYIQIGLNFQFHRKKLILTAKPLSVIRQVIVCINGCFNILC